MARLVGPSFNDDDDVIIDDVRDVMFCDDIKQNIWRCYFCKGGFVSEQKYFFFAKIRFCCCTARPSEIFISPSFRISFSLSDFHLDVRFSNRSEKTESTNKDVLVPQTQDLQKRERLLHLQGQVEQVRPSLINIIFNWKLTTLAQQKTFVSYLRSSLPEMIFYIQALWKDYEVPFNYCWDSNSCQLHPELPSSLQTNRNFVPWTRAGVFCSG